jgi:hypothetical protein
MRGLRCSIYRSDFISSHDTTNGGLSSRYDNVWVLAPNGYEGRGNQYTTPLLTIPEDDLKEGNLVKVLVREIFGSEYRCLVPCGPDGSSLDPVPGLGPMCGGNVVWTSDGRWKKLTGCDYALALHDRFETQAEYDLYST